MKTEGKATGGLKLTSHLHVVRMSRGVELYLRFPLRLFDVVFNKLSTGTYLPLSAT
jgi:hypothetical protein